MRIRGSGSGFGSFGGRDNRSNSFRQKHRLGQKVRGILLKNVADSMAWVSIDGDKLLAQLHRIHPEGARLTFIIQQLHPDIILKEVFESSAATTGVLDMAKSFDTSRMLFENEFKRDSPLSLPHSQSAFLHHMISHPNQATLFRDAANCAKTISTQLEQSGMGKIAYQPWLAPNSRRQVTLVRKPQKTLVETVVEFEHDKWGMTRAEFLFKPPSAAYKLKMQYPDHIQKLNEYLSGICPTSMDKTIELIGISKLPPRQHGGILMEMLFQTRQ